MTAQRVVPGAEPFAFDGGPVGILLLHGLTSTPASMRRVGEWLAARGHAAACPRLPGHGTHWQQLGRTRWQDWAGEAVRALKDLDGRVEAVVVLGQSVGGAIGLHLAARYPDAVRALAVVNPYVRDRRIAPAGLLKPFLRSWKGIGNDIKKPGEDELPYPRIPMATLAQLHRLMKVIRGELSRVRQPLVVFNSPEDHVVPAGTAEWLLGQVASEDTELVELPSSYHVATLDHDAELIFERTHELAESVNARG